MGEAYIIFQACLKIKTDFICFLNFKLKYDLTY